MFKRIHVFRIKPKEDLVKSILKYCEEKKIKSGVILQIIGSLEKAKLGFLKKLPGQYIEREFKGPLEIACGQGTIALKDNEVILHIHIVIGNEKMAIGGHLAPGSIVFSTAEVVIAETMSHIKRAKDKYTGLNELI